MQFFECLNDPLLDSDLIIWQKCDVNTIVVHWGIFGLDYSSLDIVLCHVLQIMLQQEVHSLINWAWELMYRLDSSCFMIFLLFNVLYKLMMCKTFICIDSPFCEKLVNLKFGITNTLKNDWVLKNTDVLTVASDMAATAAGCPHPCDFLTL